MKGQLVDYFTNQVLTTAGQQLDNTKQVYSSDADASCSSDADTHSKCLDRFGEELLSCIQGLAVRKVSL